MRLCFQKLGLHSITPHWQKTPPGLLLVLVWQGACSPRHTIKVLTTYLLQFFYLLFLLYFVLFYIGSFYFNQYSAHEVTAKSKLRFCLFVILLFLLPQLVSIRNEELQTNPDHINYINTRLWLQADNHHTIIWCNPLSVLICQTSTWE